MTKPRDADGEIELVSAAGQTHMNAAAPSGDDAPVSWFELAADLRAVTLSERARQLLWLTAVHVFG